MLSEVATMSFHNPGAWAWVCLAIPIAVFYLWHFTSRRHAVATFPLWQRALARRPASFVLRFWLSLVAQVVILLAIIAALTEPFWKDVFTARRNIALIVDVSASMSSTDVQSSRFEAMKKEARRIVSELRRGERMLLLGAGSLVRTEHGLTDDRLHDNWMTDNRETLLAAIESLKSTDGSTQIPQAVELAQSVLAGEANQQIIVLTDGAFAGAGELATAEDVQIVLFGEQASNVAITKLAASPHPIQPEQHEVLVEVANYSADDVKCDVRIGMEDNESLTVSMDVPAGTSVQEVVSCEVIQSGLLSARLQVEDAQDDLAADNEAHVFVHSRRRPVVALVTGATPAEDSEIGSQLTEPVIPQVKRILESQPRIDVLEVDAVSALAQSPDVTLLFGQVPDPLPPGPVIVFEPKGSCDLWDEAGDPISGQSAAVKTASPDSPLLSGVDFTGVVVEKAARLQFKFDAQSVVESASGESLYSVIERPEGRVVVLHVKLAPENSDLTLRTDFPALITNAVRWLMPAWESHPASITTDDIVPIVVSESKQTLKSEDAEVVIAANQSTALLDRTGKWAVPTLGGRDQGDGQIILPSNLTNPSESDLRVREGTTSAELAPLEPINDQPLWMLIVGAAIVLLFIEWCLYHRKVIV